MKNLTSFLVFLFFISSAAYSQIGFSFSYSTGKTLALDIFTVKANSRFHFGYGHQFNGQKNKVVKEREANYGLTRIEDGSFFWIIDLGYSRVIKEKLTIHPEISIGSKKEFTSYEDNRFTDNGYSLINSSEVIVGVGLNIGYFISEYIEPFVGYHTLKKVNFGLRFSF